MLSKSDIKYIVKNRYLDSEILYKARRYDGSYYLCGYVVELGLKYRICETLGWPDYPSTSNEFKKGLNSFKTHDLDVLLKLSGIDAIIKSKVLADWDIVRRWNTEKRYQPIGDIKAIDVKEMLNSSKIILGELL